MNGNGKVEKSMRIVELVAENVKRIVAIRIKPDGSMIQVTGKNAAGKTSVLDAIMMALGGKGVIPEKPIRDGEIKAKVVVDLGEIRVTRTWKRVSDEINTYLTVESKGAELKSPQAILDALVGKLSFDPLAFARMDPKRQAEVVREIAGVDFTALDQERERLYGERTEANRKQKTAEARVEVLPKGPEEVDIAALAAEHAAAMKAWTDVKMAEGKLEQIAGAGTNLKKIVSDMKAKLEEEEKSLQTARDTYAAQKVELDRMKAAVADPTPIAERLKTAEATNAEARRRKASDAAKAEAEAAAAEAGKLTEAIEAVDERKQKALADAKIPVEGMTFDEGGVFIGKTPFAQCSSSEQMRASVRIGLASSPKLRVMLVRDGSLLDSDALAEMERIAEEADAQVWIERTTDGQPVGVVIEDGEVKAPVLEVVQGGSK